jgi:hypothetical protein
MPDLPTIAHVTLTLSVISTTASSGTDDSSTWSFTGTKAQARFDELSGASKVKRSWGFTNSPIHLMAFRSMSAELVWTIWHSPVEVEVSLRRGKSG